MVSGESDLVVVGRWRGTKDAHIVLVWRDDRGSDSATESARWAWGVTPV